MRQVSTIPVVIIRHKQILRLTIILKRPTEFHHKLKAWRPSGKKTGNYKTIIWGKINTVTSTPVHTSFVNPSTEVFKVQYPFRQSYASAYNDGTGNHAVTKRLGNQWEEKPILTGNKTRKRTKTTNWNTIRRLWLCFYIPIKKIIVTQTAWINLVGSVSCLSLSGINTIYKIRYIRLFINKMISALQSRIVNGRNAAPGRFRYIVSLQKYHYHGCGGSILDQYNVITAAHCLEGDITNYYVQYGVHKIVPNDVNLIQVKKEFIHESFNPRARVHDIAILRILGDASEHLQRITIRILSVKECRKTYKFWFWKEYHICAGNRRDVRKGPCRGDSGSPLVIKAKLAGITSWSYKTNDMCGLKENPSIFTKVSPYVNWIKEQFKIINLFKIISALQSRIVNGRNAAPGRFRYIVSLQKNHYHACGGSIINRNNVITAAHCLEGDITDYCIQYGVHKIVPNDVNLIQIKKEFIHESFNPRARAHDIAVLRLSSPLSFNSKSVRPIRLPTQGKKYRVYSRGVTAGWGSVDGYASEHLQRITIHILSVKECRKAYQFWFWKEYHICAGNRRDVRKGPCVGDSGSPLIIKGKLAGLHSWGYKTNGICGLKEHPGIFTKVSQYVNWIKQVSKI
ncbi:hypothetical protein RI129_004068 [Pyrocoelia pectoralis]|uniref:Peptidase S1 domain-containing protein n=1 Tax=Pyrocoelia pectoralis TaxID=417401 RepID=A0AAN7VKS6_9COLE